MVQLLNSFNPTDFDPSQGAGSLPLGKHPVIVESAEVKGTKDNSGGYLQLNLKIIDGPAAGTTGAYRLNLYNQSKDACDIAHRQLSAVCHVTQTFQLGQDGTQIQFLYNKPFVIEVGPQKGAEAIEKGYTEIKRVFDMGGNEPGKTGTQQQQQTPQGFQQPQGQQNGQQGNSGQGAGAWNANGQGQGQGADPNAGQGAQGQGQGGWGNNQQQETPPQNQQQNNGGNAAGAGGGWSQQNNAGNNNAGSEQAKPSWGQRN